MSPLRTFITRPVFTGMLTALAGFGGMIGSIVGGTAADRFLVAYGRKWGRRLPGLMAGFLACAASGPASSRSSDNERAKRMVPTSWGRRGSRSCGAQRAWLS